MNEPTNDNDIDALLRMLNTEGWEHYHSAVTALVSDRAALVVKWGALVAERNELASRCKAHEDMLRDDLSKKQKQYDESSQTINMLHDLLGWADDGEKRIVVSVIEERDALRKRVAELEAQPPADRDLRERLVCAALTGLCADPSFDGIVVRSAIELADEALAAMRKGATDGK